MLMFVQVHVCGGMCVCACSWVCMPMYVQVHVSVCPFGSQDNARCHCSGTFHLILFIGLDLST